MKKSEKNIEHNLPEIGRDELLIKTLHKFVKLKFSEIIYIQAQGDYIELHTAQKKHLIYNSMTSMMGQLPESGFFRIHRSFIINITYITNVESGLVYLGDIHLPVGVSYKKKFMTAIGKK